MKSIIFVILAILFMNSAFGYSTLFHSHPDTVLKNLREGNWNTYIIYFYSNSEDDQDLKNSVINNAVSYYGDDVLYTEVNVSKQGYSKVLNAIEFDSSRDRTLSGSATYNQLPFVLEVVHGYGYIISGSNAHKTAKTHIQELINLGNEQKLETYH
mmetsp:Transcript_18836/g.16674  ORF Transcript_18836/g.16674 Transcript_18836/m.16674 type:complete len:155 (+) Transcript_18836:57-521(+)